MRCEITSNLIFIALIAMKAIKYNYIETFFIALIAMNAINRRYNSTLNDTHTHTLIYIAPADTLKAEC